MDEQKTQDTTSTDQGEKVDVRVEQTAPTDPKATTTASNEAENTDEDKAEGSEEDQTETKATENATTQSQTTAAGAQVQPIEVKGALNDIHRMLSNVSHEVQISKVTAMHDVAELVAKLEEAKMWVVDKLEQYDPALAAELRK